MLTAFVAAWRSVRATPVAALAAVVTLALGVGANVAVLAVAYGALWRPLPLEAPDRLVTITVARQRDASSAGTIRIEDLDAWRAALSTVSGVAGWATGEFGVQGLGVPRVVRAAIVTQDFFAVLGARAETGRLIGSADAPNVAVLAREFTATLAGGEPLSAAPRIDALTFQPVGVLPAAFPVPDRVDVWIPLAALDALQVGRFSNLRSLRMVARLRPGVSLAQAQADATRVLRALELSRGRAGDSVAIVTPLGDALVGDVRPVLLVFAGAGLLLFGVACANVASFFAGRGAGRVGEYALRLALGASPWRLITAVLAESALVALAAAIIGVVLAALAVTWLAPLVGEAVPRRAIAVGAPALVLGLLAAFVATVIAGVAPALAAVQTRSTSALSRTRMTASTGTRRLRSGLLVLQIAMAVVLLVGAGLLARTVEHLLATDSGVDADETIVLRLRTTATSRFDADAEVPVLDAVLGRVRRIPGVAVAGIGTNVPPATAPVAFSIAGPAGDPSRLRSFELGSASPGYFEAIGARLLHGRWFEERDRTGPPVAVLTETAARQIGDTRDPIGRRLEIPLTMPSGRRVEPIVVGIIEDIRHGGLDAEPRGGIYVPLSYLPAGIMYLAIRPAGPALPLGPAVVDALRDVAPAIPVPVVNTLAQTARRSVADRELRATLVAAFASLSALLALTGLSTAIGRSVFERRRELAIRAAVGATPGRTIRLVLVEAAVITLAGVGAGLSTAALIGRSTSALLYGISPYDVLTFGVVAGAVSACALGAAWLPARRAARINPLELLRTDA